MAHQRKLIRQAVVALLASANTAAAARVSSSRVDPYRKGQLPAISVYALSEEVDEGSVQTAPRELTRNVKIGVAFWVAGGDEGAVADAIDDLAEQIEAAMDGDRYLGGAAGESILESTDGEIREGDGRSDPLIGEVVLTYSVTYRTSPAAPANLDDFRTVGATVKPTGGVSDTPTVSDTFTVQEP